MTCDDIVNALREECTTCSERSDCRNGVNLAGLYCANSDAADLIENQQNHIRALLQANDALRSAWIPVTEGLPEADTEVLLITKGWGDRLFYVGFLHPMEAETSCLTGIESKPSDWTIWGWSYLKEPNVTHWMPLPEAPEEH